MTDLHETMAKLEQTLAMAMEDIKSLQSQIKPEPKPVSLTEACWVRLRDGDMDIALRVSGDEEFPWQLIVIDETVRDNGTYYRTESETDVVEVLRPLTKDECFEVCNGREIRYTPEPTTEVPPDAGEIWNPELTKECHENGWVYLGASANEREVQFPTSEWEYEIISTETPDDVWESAGSPLHEWCMADGRDLHYRRRKINKQ